ncbi:MAG: hypothetical protein IT336_03960 [Thermomicrobiales bacterium]|nr:hypothetical protein [Thermomicrobiales bacterium]
MTGRTPSEAVQTYITSVAEALLCITQQRLSRPPSRGLEVDTLHEANLADMDPVRLAGLTPLTFSAGQNDDIVEHVDGYSAERFRIRPRGYFCETATDDDRQILSFHWQPEAKPSRAGDHVVTTPHMHVGAAIAAGQTAIRPHDFHKVHVPMGHVSLPGLIWLLIDQLGVAPLNPNWRHVLTRSAAPFPG